MSEPQIFRITTISQILISLILNYHLYNQNQRNLPAGKGRSEKSV